MDARDATANNADLWTHYLRQQWKQFLDPFALADTAIIDAATRTLAEVAASNVAGMLTMLVAPTVGRMYRANVPDVDRALNDARIAAEEHIEIPAPYAASRTPCGDMTQREEWVVSSVTSADIARVG